MTALTRRTSPCLARLFLGAALVSLAACGGGGGGEEVPAPVPAPAAPTSVDVGGTVSGLAAGKSFAAGNLGANDVVLQSATLTQNGTYSIPLPVGTSYNLRVLSQPAGQTCVLANGMGVASATVTNIAVTCSDNTYRVGGSVAGLTGPVVVRNNNADETTIVASGTFTFAVALAEGTSYSVTVQTPPAGQTCSVANGTGTVSAAVTSVQLNCATAPVVVEPPPAPPPPPPPPPPLAAPSAPLNLSISYSVKTFNFTWSASATATSYQLYEDVDGPGVGGFVAVGGTVAATSTSYVVSPLLHRRLNARYAVQACNAGGCSASTPFVVPNLTPAIGYLKASNTRADGRFGRSVAMSADGTTLAVGANGDSSNATGINGNQADASAVDAGAVYVFVRIGGVWTQQAYIKASNARAGSLFGESVWLSADGNTLAVGASEESSNATGINGNQADTSASLAGSAYVFVRTGTVWTQQAYVKASNTRNSARFGSDVVLSADGNTLAASSPFEESNATGINGNQADTSAGSAGAVYVFTRAGSTWTQQAYVKASNTQAGDVFGRLALSADGNTLAVGAQQEDSNATGVNGNQADESAPTSGALYVFVRSAGVWTQQAYLKASNTRAGAQFGSAAALSADGNTLAVGALREDSAATGINGNQADTSASNAGALYVFTRAGGVWTQQAYIKASNTAASQNFAYPALSADGNTLAVGSLSEDSNAVGIGGNQADTSANNAGALYIFVRSAGTWTQQAYVKAPNTGSNDRFGPHVSLAGDGNSLAVAAEGEASSATGVGGNQADNSALGAGAIYLY